MLAATWPPTSISHALETTAKRIRILGSVRLTMPARLRFQTLRRLRLLVFRHYFFANQNCGKYCCWVGAVQPSGEVELTVFEFAANM